MVDDSVQHRHVGWCPEGVLIRIRILVADIVADANELFAAVGTNEQNDSHIHEIGLGYSFVVRGGRLRWKCSL